MGSIATVRIEMNRTKKESLYNFCSMNGLLVNKFFENAVEHEVDRLLDVEGKVMFRNYEKRKKHAIEFR